MRQKDGKSYGEREGFTRVVRSIKMSDSHPTIEGLGIRVGVYGGTQSLRRGDLRGIKVDL